MSKHLASATGHVESYQNAYILSNLSTSGVTGRSADAGDFHLIPHRTNQRNVSAPSQIRLPTRTRFVLQLEQPQHARNTKQEASRKKNDSFSSMDTNRCSRSHGSLRAGGQRSPSRPLAYVGRHSTRRSRAVRTAVGAIREETPRPTPRRVYRTSFRPAVFPRKKKVWHASSSSGHTPPDPQKRERNTHNTRKSATWLSSKKTSRSFCATPTTQPKECTLAQQHEDQPHTPHVHFILHAPRARATASAPASGRPSSATRPPLRP